jgi:hypothetical protein
MPDDRHTSLADLNAAEAAAAAAGERVAPISVRLAPAVDARLREEARLRLVSPTLLINRAVERFLDELVPVEEHLRTRRPTAGIEGALVGHAPAPTTGEPDPVAAP